MALPDVIIEILWPGNKEYDLVKKKALYERFRVKKYWIVDPQTKIAFGYFLEKSRYISLGQTQSNIPFTLLNHTIAF